MVGKTNTEKKKMTPILWFLFAIVIPLIIVITLAVIIMGVAGFNVFDWAKEKGNTLPVISEWVTTDEEKAVVRDEEHIRETMSQKDEEIKNLTQNINDLETNIDQLEQEIVRLEKNEPNAASAAANPEENEEDEALKMIISSYEEMDSEQAALILQNMDSDSTLSILRGLSNEVRGEILEAFEPESCRVYAIVAK